MFRRWAKLIGEDHWLTDPRFKDDLARGDHGEIVSKRMSEWTAERTTAEALGELEAARIAAGAPFPPPQRPGGTHGRAARPPPGSPQPGPFPPRAPPAPP